ncbi:hypothetical protein CBL_12237 [Carabus blaptoides fortunei]
MNLNSCRLQINQTRLRHLREPMERLLHSLRYEDSLPKSSDSVSKRQSLQYSLDDSFKVISSFQEGGRKNMQIAQALLYLICKDNLPFYTVEKSGFLKLMKTTVPLYKPPTRKTMKKIIEEKYDLTSEKFKEKLSAQRALL